MSFGASRSLSSSSFTFHVHLCFPLRRLSLVFCIRVSNGDTGRCLAPFTMQTVQIEYCSGDSCMAQRARTHYTRSFLHTLPQKALRGYASALDGGGLILASHIRLAVDNGVFGHAVLAVGCHPLRIVVGIP